MNVCFVMQPEYKELEKDFIDFASTKGIVGIIAPARMDYADVCAKLIAFTQAVSGVTGNGMKRLKDAGESDDRRNESADRSAK